MKKKWLGLGLFLLLSLWLLLEFWIYFYGLNSSTKSSDCILVLGARSLADGTPGPSLTARCDWAYELWKRKCSDNILCTGGLGADGTVESEVSRAYLCKKGVPSQCIEVESRSHNTRENLMFAQQIMKRRGWEDCLIVTDPFHELRAIWIAEQIDLPAEPSPTYSGPAWRRMSSWLWYQCRESASFLKLAWESI